MLLYSNVGSCLQKIILMIRQPSLTEVTEPLYLPLTVPVFHSWTIKHVYLQSIHSDIH